MKKVLVGIVVLAVAIAAAYLILGRGRSGQRVSQEPGQVSPPVKASAEVVAEARVLPVRGVTLSAAVDGTVAWVGPRAGEFVAPGAPVVRVGDLSAWQVETTDLTELSVVSVRAGSQAKVTFDGIPGLELTGKVVQIKAFGENRMGDITYTVAIAPDRQDERLRWNMTASVAIEPK